MPASLTSIPRSGPYVPGSYLQDFFDRERFPAGSSIAIIHQAPLRTLESDDTRLLLALLSRHGWQFEIISPQDADALSSEVGPT